MRRCRKRLDADDHVNAIPAETDSLLESGIDLRYILELLGHKSSKTKDIYILCVQIYYRTENPLDSLAVDKNN